jgi:hypothetical protein
MLRHALGGRRSLNKSVKIGGVEAQAKCEIVMAALRKAAAREASYS